MFSILVGKSTICSHPMSLKVSEKCWEVVGGGGGGGGSFEIFIA